MFSVKVGLYGANVDQHWANVELCILDKCSSTLVQYTVQVYDGQVWGYSGRMWGYIVQV